MRQNNVAVGGCQAGVARDVEYGVRQYLSLTTAGASEAKEACTTLVKLESRAWRACDKLSVEDSLILGSMGRGSVTEGPGWCVRISWKKSIRQGCVKVGSKDKVWRWEER